MNKLQKIIILFYKTKRCCFSINSSFYLPICIGTVLFFILLSSFAENELSVNSTMDKNIIEKQEKELKVNFLLKEANNNFFNKQYKLSIDKYLEAISILSNNFPLTNQNNKRISEIKNSIGLAYASWAEEILIQAQTESDNGNLDKAKKLARQAAEVNPKIKTSADRIIEKLNHTREKQNFIELTTDTTTKNLTKNKNYNISVLFEQGKILFKNNNLDRAKNRFEEILSLDPYNYKAINYLNEITKKQFDDGGLRRDQTGAQRLGEAIWASVTPVTSENFEGKRIDISGASNTKISKAGEKTTLETKLNELKIPSISLDNVPAEDALLYIQAESKRLDPSGEGINIITKLGDSPEQYNVTITAMKNLPLIQAIKYICQDAGINYSITKYAVVVSRKQNFSNQLYTRVFEVDRTNFGSFLSNSAVTPSTAIDMKKYFTTREVNFPQGASAVYDFRISRLIVRNIPEELKKIQQILEKLDREVRPQVSIAAKFVEVSQSDFDELGFEWAISKSNSHVSTPKLSTATRNAYSDAIGSREAKQPDRMFKVAYSSNNWSVSAALHALAQSSTSETLSSPRVTTLNGYTTVIKVVTERYFPETWSEPELLDTTANNQTMTYVTSAVPSFGTATDIGVILKVTPFINSDNYTIDLVMEPIVQAFENDSTDYYYDINIPWNDNSNGDNNLVPKTVTKRYPYTMPIISSRSIRTRLQVYDGDTIVLGGALTDETTKVNDKIPIIGDFPLIGRFFQSEVESVEKRNLLIFTTVRLILSDGTPLRPLPSDGRANFNDKF